MIQEEMEQFQGSLRGDTIGNSQRRPMSLKLRPAGLGSGIDKDRPHYTVYIGEWEVGRLYETRGGRQSALVLVADHHRPDDALGSRGDPWTKLKRSFKEFGRVEGVGESGRGTVVAISGSGWRKHSQGKEAQARNFIK
jgi:hypothetical protein